ncbi:MAG TPA: DUF6799 domain-containing protein [Bacteroidia bacterium]|nr:DUF6799 domain-containing protein [Bacteroidia bacterium]
MKKIALTFIVLSISLAVHAQSNDDKSGDDNNYCVQTGGNEIQVVHQGIIVILDVILDNGTTVKKDGTIITKDGKKTLLRVGECINQDGTM